MYLLFSWWVDDEWVCYVLLLLYLLLTTVGRPGTIYSVCIYIIMRTSVVCTPFSWGFSVSETTRLAAAAAAADLK